MYGAVTLLAIPRKEWSSVPVNDSTGSDDASVDPTMTTSSTGEHPDAIVDELMLDDVMSRPSARLIEQIGSGTGDLIVLGAGGKMGPTIVRMAHRAFLASGRQGAVIAVSRFSDRGVYESFKTLGVQTQVGDLLDPNFLSSLPDAPDVVFMAGRKFGSTGAEHLTWAMNAYLPGLVADRYRDARVVVFSTGAVYPFTTIHSGGADEDIPPEPIGEYAQSCLARERMFAFAADAWGTQVATIRLSYALDLRYGVLVDIAESVRDGRPVDLGMGAVSVIWQGDACDLILRSLDHVSTPPFVLNVSGLQPVSVTDLAVGMGHLLGIDPVFEGEAPTTALILDCSRMAQTVGDPEVSIRRVMDWTCRWLQTNGRTLGKPTHFNVRDGKF